MRTKNQNESLPTEERLALALSAVAEPLRTELFNFFFLSNPIELAGKLLSLELPTDLTRELLLCKVSEPRKYRGPDLSVLAERAMEAYWQRLGETHGGLGAE
jgi:hypothetical protein